MKHTSKLTIDEFLDKWYDGDEIDPDSIEDETLKGMYVELLALNQDASEVEEKIERYLDAHKRDRPHVHGEGDEDPNEQPYLGRYRFSD